MVRVVRLCSTALNYERINTTSKALSKTTSKRSVSLAFLPLQEHKDTVEIKEDYSPQRGGGKKGEQLFRSVLILVYVYQIHDQCQILQHLMLHINSQCSVHFTFIHSAQGLGSKS